MILLVPENGCDSDSVKKNNDIFGFAMFFTSGVFFLCFFVFAQSQKLQEYHGFVPVGENWRVWDHYMQGISHKNPLVTV